MLPTDHNFGLEQPNMQGILTYLDSNHQKIIEKVASEKGDFNTLFDSVYENLRKGKDYLIYNQDIISQIEILESR